VGDDILIALFCRVVFKETSNMRNCGSKKFFYICVEMFVLTISKSIFFPNFKEHLSKCPIYVTHPHECLSVCLSVCLCVCVCACVCSPYSVGYKIAVTLVTVSGVGGALGLGEALENRVRPLVEGGGLKRLEGADRQTGERTRRKRGKSVSR